MAALAFLTTVLFAAPPPGSLVTSDELRSLMTTPDRRKIEAIGARLRTCTAYLRVGLGDELHANFSSNKVIAVEGSPKKGDYNLGRVRDRAMWAFEQLFGVKLAPSGGMKSAMERSRGVLDGYRSGIAALDRERGLATIDSLRRKYEHKISLEIGPRGASSVGPMNKLLIEWMPIGKSINDLETVVGAKGERRGGHVHFVFDGGIVGTAFRFRVDGDRILSCIVESTD